MVWRSSIGHFTRTRRVLAAFRDRAGPGGAERTLLGDIEKMARKVTGRPELHATVVPESERERILARYAFGSHPIDLEIPQDGRDQGRPQSTSGMPGRDIRSVIKSSGPSRGLNVFISFARADREIAELIARYLQTLASSIYVFLPDSILPGADWRREIANALLKTDLMLIVLSAHANEFHGYETGQFLSGGRRPKCTGDKDYCVPRSGEPSVFIIAIPVHPNL